MRESLVWISMSGDEGVDTEHECFSVFTYAKIGRDVQVEYECFTLIPLKYNFAKVHEMILVIS